ncbi:MAG TPA: cell division protein ZapA [Halanaerobiales bacterium]|nr:cell division protein ZapA [Halanaerobiales bacterium]
MEKYKEENKFTVKILDEELVVKGKVSEDYVRDLAEYINNVGQEIQETYPRLPRRSLLGLTMINIADDLFKTKSELQNLKEENEDLKEVRDKLIKDNNSLKRDNRELNNLLEEVD